MIKYNALSEKQVILKKLKDGRFFGLTSLGWRKKVD
jgi:hypothetical protein